MIFSMEKKVGSALELSPKGVSHWASTNLKIWAENSNFAIQDIGNREKKVLSNPPPVTTLIIL